MEKRHHDFDNAFKGVIATHEPEFSNVIGSLRRHATSCDLPSLAHRIASSKALQIRLGHEVAAPRKEIHSAQAAARLSVTCNSGAGALLQLQAIVDAELARRAIECIGPA